MRLMYLPLTPVVRWAAVVAATLVPVVTRAAIPEDARNTILRVHAAAANEDFAALRLLMVRDFQWSFGGDTDAQQALDAWKADPKYLRNLRRVTSQACGFITRQIVQCPVKAGASFRAGFERTPDGWRMRYFLEGE